MATSLVALNALGATWPLREENSGTPRTHSWLGLGNSTEWCQSCCIFHSILRLLSSCTQVSLQPILQTKGGGTHTSPGYTHPDCWPSHKQAFSSISFFKLGGKVFYKRLSQFFSLKKKNLPTLSLMPETPSKSNKGGHSNRFNMKTMS